MTDHNNASQQIRAPLRRDQAGIGLGINPNPALSAPRLLAKRRWYARLKVGVGLIGAILAVIFLTIQPNIEEGTALIIVAMLAGASWSLNQIVFENQTRQNIASGYISAIDRLTRETEFNLSRAELDRFLELAPLIKSGAEGPSWRAPKHSILDDLPNLKDHRHLLSPATIEALTSWAIIHVELSDAYDMLGTKEMADISLDRLERYFTYIEERVQTYGQIAHRATVELTADLSRDTLADCLPSSLLKRFNEGTTKTKPGR